MSDLTFADVASKSVDHLAAGVKTVADAAQKIAPHAWEIAVRQQKMEGAREMLEGALVLAICVTVIIITYRARHWIVKDLDDRFPACMPAVIAFIAGCIAVNAGTEGWMYWSNPEYYAAKALIEAAK